MANKFYPKSNLPIRRTVELLPVVFQSSTNEKFLSGVLDPLVQPGVLDKVVGYVGKRYDKTYSGKDIYVDTDNTLRSRYQLEPGVVYRRNDKIENFYDYLDFKNQLRFFGNEDERDDLITNQIHYSWNPPIDWDKFVNYREYYWEPTGPLSISISGQSLAIRSTYKVILGELGNTYVFTPDSYTINPSLTLYRGQTYNFRINTPGQPFSIRRSYDTGSLLFVPGRSYLSGSLVVYDNKLWRAIRDVSNLDGSSITIDSQDWQYVEPASTGDALAYDNGVQNNGLENGTLTFTVPFDAPDILYYQSQIDPNIFGKFIISDIEENTFVNVDLEIIGKTDYVSGNGISLSNGMIVEFSGNVSPSKYSTDAWLVEGVGSAITLTKFTDLIVPVLTTEVPEVLFDNEGFDTLPFDDATEYASFKDYVTISRDSLDGNPWSRYNRWFHRSILEQAYASRGEDFPAAENTRAKRPIIEFKPNIKLFNHGSTAKQVVDYIDRTTTDIFSIIEGAKGYNIDGEFIFEGARILVVADTDNLANNKIYTVEFINHLGSSQIHLREANDSESFNDECVLVRRGKLNKGKMFHYNGTSWVESQAKTTVNQSPLFDAFDHNEVSFGDAVSYPNTTFAGTKILSYKEGIGKTDTELGFKLSYLNIDNIGDIQFQWNWDIDQFVYSVDRTPVSKKISTGFYKVSASGAYSNGWQVLDNQYIQPIIDSVRIDNETNVINFKTIKWENLQNDPTINFYVNGKKYQGSWTRDLDKFTFPVQFKEKDIVVIKLIHNIPPENGYYELPLGIEKNPLNATLESFTLGQALDHIVSSVEWNNNFTGEIPGNSNLRDLPDYEKYAKRFLHHSGITPLAVMALCDKTHNIIKSIQHAKQSYSEFKNNFIQRAIEINFFDNIADFVDEVINSLTSVKKSTDAFSDSDMIGAGAYNSIKNVVEDTGITTFALSEKFDLQTLSTRAVYVYKNNQQLLNTKEYTFDSTFGFVKLLVELNVGDEIEIREYLSTRTNHIPPTPTSMGLYKKYIPSKFLDDTYIEPREVIQGHDGSLTLAYGDYRDDLLLELEFRIYNNIKQEYNTTVFDIDSVLAGYHEIGTYSKSQLDAVVAQDFMKWIQNTNINYTINEYFDSENSFTYTYNRMTDPTRTKNIPGYWRGVYKHFYDTDRPHRCPWEMLGFTIKPDWWDQEYGPAPYTSNNLILWEDLQNGVIKQGDNAGRYDRYKRPGLLERIPVDGDGNLLSPLDSNLAQDFSLINNRGPFVFGDVGPVEYAWRSSSEWPFAVVNAMCLMKPFEYITENFDRSNITINKLGQYVNKNTNLFVTLSDLAPAVSSNLSVGLVKYLVSYTKSRGMTIDSLETKIKNLDVALTYRMSGFVDQTQQKFLLDSKNPAATTSSVFVPPENFDIIFNVSSPISVSTYSGVILEKSNNGWVVNGYDDVYPYFSYYAPRQNQKDPLISVGGINEPFTNWIENKTYANGVVVKYQSNFYRALKTHNSGNDFDKTVWQKLGALPKKNATEAFLRRSFNTFAVSKLSYGTVLTSIQQVVDFLLGYQSYLEAQGFVFDRYDPENQTSQDWLSSAKEFMFWTKNTWKDGAVISLSPAAQRIQLKVPVGVADNLLDGFYDYNVKKGDGQPLNPSLINVKRSFQEITIETTNTNEGLYYVKFYYVLKEHVTVFDDRTVFNDIIYDKTTGYRQGRIKVQSFRTVDWDGDYTSPGFLFDNVDIKTWQPFVDYKLGDIVEYKSYKWTSLVNQIGVQSFDEGFWTKLDSSPKKQLIPNFDYKIKQFSDYFETSTDGVDQSQRDLARHAIGYQKRDYLQNIAQDSVSQFLLYQGFIREKGTANSIKKIFDKLSRSGSDSIALNEEWAFLLSRFGGIDQFTELEIRLVKNEFVLDPQLFIVRDIEVNDNSDKNIKITPSDFTIAPIPYTSNIIPTTYDLEPFLTAGYILTSHIQHVVSTMEQLTSLDITNVNENDHIWITFYQDSWNVLRLNDSPLLYVIEATRVDTTQVLLTLNRPHFIEVNQYIGIREILNLTGFFKVVVVSNNTITVEVSADVDDPEIDISTTVNLQLLSPARFAEYDSVDKRTAALLKNKSRLFIDNNGDNLWEVVEKNKLYAPKTFNDFGTSLPLKTGSKVIYDNNLKHIFVSLPGSGIINLYVELENSLQLKQIITPPIGFSGAVLGSFGEKMAVSPDGKYLIVGAPLASGVTNKFLGEWGPDVRYEQDDIVLYGGRLYRALNNNTVIGDGSTELAIATDDWTEHTTVIPATTSGKNPGYIEQGMVVVYEFVSGRFTPVKSFVSPRPSDNEKFGSEICIGHEGANYYLSISALGSYNNTGRVYLIKYDGQDWYHMENPAYRGIYNLFDSYRQGDIVWQASQDPIAEGVRGNLWTSLDDSTSDGSTITLDSQNWLKVSDISTHCSLPTNISVEDDGSTLEFAYTGLLTNTQKAELVKPGDRFGFSMAMSKDASILVIGAPDADGEFFANYRGIWRADVEYVEGEVVRHKGSPGDNYQYYQLGDAYLGADSTYRSFNEDPSDSVNWSQVGDSTTSASGKIFVYKKTEFDSYELTQMINAASLASFTDIDSGLVISTGDQFGFALDIDSSGNTLVVTSPRSDINYQDQGAIYVLTLDKPVTEFRVQQRLQSFETYADEYFGYAASISPDASKIAVGSRNTKTPLQINFDILQGTTFDNARTRFYEEQGFTGGVYVFDKKDNIFFLTEKLDAVLQANESFGYSVDCVGSHIVVGSPYYKNEITGTQQGIARLFKASNTAVSWTTLTQQSARVDITKIKKIELYDNVKNIKLQDIDYIDAAKGKILDIAEKEIKYKTPYDPAAYSIGTDQVVVDTSINWLEKNVGKLWWNTSTAKFIDAEQQDYSYKKGNWNQLVEGSSIDVYEWIETVLLPNEWAAVADTNEGLAQGISGQPLYPNNDVYSFKIFYNNVTGEISETYYYYWVKSKATVPTNMPDRTKSAAEVAALIASPASSGAVFMAFVDKDKFITYNFQKLINSDTALLNLQFRNNYDNQVPVHSEYQLLTEGVSDSLPSVKLENKWIDSLVGTDIAGNRVPDTDLPEKQKYGISYRPRQSMFVDRVLALRIVIEYINEILKKEIFADVIDFTNLNLVDEQPSEELNVFDVTVDTDLDLQNVGTVRTKRAVLRGNLINGELDTIDIIDAGFGYKPKQSIPGTVPQLFEGPPVTISGDGINAAAISKIDGQGRIVSVEVTNKGKKYSVINIQVRYFSVLVKNDSTINNWWSIYSWDNTRQAFFRSKSQAYDTTRYWDYIDWVKPGYDSNFRIIREYISIYDEEGSAVNTGDIIKVKEYASGGWAIFEKISNTGQTFLDRYTLISRQKGTIELSNALYDTSIFGVGFDNAQPFDTTIYDIENAYELRNIFKAVKENIFIGDYSVEWNKLFFTSMRHVLSEQGYVDWMFKTSFVNATHNIGSFEEKPNYKNDNLDSFKQYIEEVKPYRTTVREYVSRYDTTENYQSSTADFDLPPQYSSIEGKVVAIGANSTLFETYPWKWWTDNNGYSVTSITVYNQGSGYNNPPTVLIEGDGVGATAQAFISNGKVSGIRLLNQGSGYSKAPTVTLVGGNSSGSQAKASAVIGNSSVRTFNLGIKFDRISKSGIYSSVNQTQTFVANGSTAVFALNYAPTRDKNKIQIFITKIDTGSTELVLSSQYTINLYYSSTDSYSLLRGKIIFKEPPKTGDIIEVEYEKNTTLLDAVNRINLFYQPSSGMIGKEINQLMTGIDFGGVQIQGTTFEVTGGWDALPWFTDNWDSVETSADYYVVCDGSTITVKLPYVPSFGQKINIYIKRLGTDKTVRIDDENYELGEDSSTGINPNAEMPTFIGNGVNDVVEIGDYLSTRDGDILIFRPIESDGAVTITDENLLDTKLSGGSLSAISGAYVTATGTSAEEITVSGGKFIEPDHVPAPEEVIPGQVLESVSIKVFQSQIRRPAQLQTNTTTANGVDTIFPIGQTILENKSVFVYVNNIKQLYDIDYTIDLQNYNVVFSLAPQLNDFVEIISIGIGGFGILDYQIFTADGETNLFLTNATYEYTSSVFVTVNGNQIDVGFRNSTGIVDATNRTLVEFGVRPAVGDIIKIVCIEAASDVDSLGYPIVQVNTETFYFEGSTRSFDLTNFVNLTRGSSSSSMIVEVNGTVLKGPDTIYTVYDGTNNVFTLGTDPIEPGGSILPANIKVFINGELIPFITDYVYDGPTKVLSIYPAVLAIGDTIKIENDLRAQFSVVNNNIVIDSSVDMGYTGDSTSSKINVTWFGEYPSLDIISDQKSGGKVQYQLSRTPISTSYVWVYKNGQRLRQDKDYYVSLPRAVVYLNVPSTLNDDITTFTFSSNTFALPVAYEVNKDMLNVYRYNRYSKDETRLSKNLYYYDTTIEVTDDTNLTTPIPSRNLPGVILINGERIEYMIKDNNVLGQIRRGSQGTSIAEMHAVGDAVVDVGYQSTIPYNETQDRVDFYSDGSTLLLGPLDFIPQKASRNSSWTRTSIPASYGPCDMVEVFAAGQRLRKDPQTVYNESNGASSPDADIILEAEFSVDGAAAFIRLTTALPAGTRVTVIRRLGRTWYDRGQTTASNGLPLVENLNAIAKFIVQKPTSLPE